MTTAQQTRLTARDKLIDTMFDGHGNYQGGDDTETRTLLAQSIRSLKGLGRTDRWQNAVEAWALTVEDETHPVRHALLQGAIFAGHAA